MAWFQTTDAALHQSSKALLVIAHPDDEVMFFSPLLEWFSKNDGELHVLCLSTGNFDGLGKIRQQELVKCLDLFNVSPDRIYIFDNPLLQDGMNNSWPIDTISCIVKECIIQKKIDLVGVIIHFIALNDA